MHRHSQFHGPVCPGEALAGLCQQRGSGASCHPAEVTAAPLQTDQPEEPVNRSHARARTPPSAPLARFPATHLNIMLNSFRASSVTPVVFLKRKQQSS